MRYSLWAAIVAFTFSTAAYSWGQTGHRVGAAIAEQYLTAEARTAIDSILENETLAEISTYADEMRSNPDDFWQKEAGPYHYVTVPQGKTYAEVGAPPQGDSVVALEKFAKVLRDPRATRAEKQLALKFTVHIIGDLHQPLHAGNGTDRGGNDFKLAFARKPSNLHRVWDSDMIDSKDLSFTEWSKWLSAKISPEMAQAWMDPDPKVWIAESAKIRDTIYPDNDRLSWQYTYDHIPTVKLRLQQSGVRIAAYLNQLFADS